jgi:hypothetical protein
VAQRIASLAFNVWDFNCANDAEAINNNTHENRSSFLNAGSIFKIFRMNTGRIFS